MGTRQKESGLAAWPVKRAAQEFGVSPDTITRKLREAGHQVGGHQRWTVRQLFTALSAAGDIKEARFRRESAEAALAELDLAERRRDLVPVAEVVDFIARLLQPFRARMLAAPAVLGTAANPTDPVHGHKAVERWVDGILPLLREDILEAWKRGEAKEEETEEEHEKEKE